MNLGRASQGARSFSWSALNFYGMTPMPKRRQHLEQRLQKAVLEHLAWRGVHGLFAFHYPAGGWRSPVEAAIFKSLGVVAGIPDILIIYDGHCFALELKTARGRLTPTQAETQTKMRAAGATVATAVELDAALEQLEQWGLLRSNVAIWKASSLLASHGARS